MGTEDALINRVAEHGFVPLDGELIGPSPEEVMVAICRKLADPVDEHVQRIYDAWQSSVGGRRRMTDARRKLIETRLKEGYTEQDLTDAVRGWQFSAWHRGDDPRTGGKKYNSLELLLRDADKVERFRDLYREHRFVEKGTGCPLCFAPNPKPSCRQADCPFKEN